MKTKFILETSTLEDILMKKYNDMKDQESEECPKCKKTPCQCDKNEQGVAEGHTDQQRKVFKKNGEPVGEVGIDRESSPGNGQWYMKCYANGIDNVGYDSYEEAVAELKHCLKQGVAEGTNDYFKRRKDEEDRIAGTKAPAKRTPRQTDYEKKRKEQGVAEGANSLRATMVQQQLDVVEKIKSSNLPDVVKLYLIAINDPKGAVVKAAYRSFPKGQEAREKIKDLFVQKYNVSREELENADSGWMAQQLQGVAEGSFDPKHYFDANKDSKVRRDTEVTQSQHKQDWGRDPLDDLTQLAFTGAKKVKNMFSKKQSELNELGANNPPQNTPATANTAPTTGTVANAAASTQSLNPQQQQQLTDLLKRAGITK